MHITKMHGAGNDFVIINNIIEKLSREELSALAEKLCTPHLSVGANGLMAVEEAKNGGDYTMVFFNSDGSEGEMCGNGARCIARYGHDNGLAGDTQRIETISGTVVGQRITDSLYRIRLNDPSVAEAHRSVTLDGQIYDCAYVELGVPGLPHAVLLIEDGITPPTDKLFSLGAALRSAPEFPRGANVSFVSIADKNRVKAVTFERGVEDFTLACGTGCGAITTALTLRGIISGAEPLTIEMPGGTLSVSLTHENSSIRDIYLTGPAVTVFEAELAE